MAQKALLVVDMLKDFIYPDGALHCGSAGQGIVPYTVELVGKFKAAQEPVILIMDAHSVDDNEFTRFPRHCVSGTRGAELIDELDAQLKGYERVLKIPKTRFSGFYHTDLEHFLEDLSPAEIHVVGVCTNICVLYTVEELRNRDYMTIVHAGGVASFDEDAHRWALAQMKTVLGAEVKSA